MKLGDILTEAEREVFLCYVEHLMLETKIARLSNKKVLTEIEDAELKATFDSIKG